MYKLTVTKIIPWTTEEKKTMEDRANRFGQGLSQFEQSNLMSGRVMRTVEVELTDEEYNTLRQSLLEFWDRV